MPGKDWMVECAITGMRRAWHSASVVSYIWQQEIAIEQMTSAVRQIAKEMMPTISEIPERTVDTM